MENWITSSGVADKRIKEEAEEIVEALEEEILEEEEDEDEDEGTT